MLKIFYITVILQFSILGFSAQRAAQGRVKIIKALSIVKNSDLNFPSAVQGDGAATVPSGTSENASNASFTVNGQANTSYNIILPNNGTVQMITAGGGLNKSINVDNFTSFPAPGANGLLNGSGTQKIFVGATRAVISSNQVTGNYTTSFQITVIY